MAEVSVLIQETDAGQREIRIARGFQMIAGEDAQVLAAHDESSGPGRIAALRKKPLRAERAAP